MDIFYPLQIISNWLVYSLFSIGQDSLFAETLVFFIYDLLKIFLLLIVITHLMSLVRFYLPIEKLRDFLSSRKWYGIDYLLASLFGAITPFCSCSSIPLFIGFIGSGIPLGVTFAFLITSPLVNEVAVALFISAFGLKVTVWYVVSGIAIGMIGGYLLGKMKLEKYVERFVFDAKVSDYKPLVDWKKDKMKVFGFISKEAFGIIKQVALYIVIGVGVGAVIHGYVPQNFFEGYLQKAGVLGVPLAVILGVPLYANATGVIPIIQALVDKGVPIGTALAFMMATVGLSFPEAMILKKVLKLRLLLYFFGLVTLGIMIIGFLFNFLIFI